MQSRSGNQETSLCLSRPIKSSLVQSTVEHLKNSSIWDPTVFAAHPIVFEFEFRPYTTGGPSKDARELAVVLETVVEGAMRRGR